MKTLYHYVHCPYCVRVRMALGFLDENYLSKVLPYNDEKTPIDLTGTKMLPIMKFENDTIMNESLDIIGALDSEHKIPRDFLDDAKKVEWIEGWLNLLGKDVHNLAMPYWIWTPEFNETSRQYFVDKKSKKRGPFNELAKRRSEFEESILINLKRLENELSPWFLGKDFSLADIMLAAHLWGLYVVPEFRFSERMHFYMQSVKKVCQFDYHTDFWTN